jgi:hypothetical protein
LKKENFLKLVFAVWLTLWVFFLVREDKDGQYKTLKFLYTHNTEEKTGYIMGEELYGFLLFCRDNVPAGSTYELTGFKKFSIDEVRARYFLWPLRNTSENPDFKIVYSRKKQRIPGYNTYKQHDGAGYLLVREDLSK